MVSKKLFFLLFFIGKNRHGIGKNVAFTIWEWGPNSAPREGQKIPCIYAGETHAGKVKL